MNNQEVRRAIIGGTGFSERAQNFERIKTDYGDVNFGHLNLGGKDVIFLARHQKLQIPSQVNYRANVEALKLLGVDTVFSVSAAGRMAENVLPGHLVNLSDLDWENTGPRETTFAENECLMLHAPLAGLFSLELRKMINQSWEEVNTKIAEIYQKVPGLSVGFHEDGTYFNTESPWFNTEAREQRIRESSHNIKLIGQTLIPESALLRELGIAQATIGMCTDHSTFPGAVRVHHAGEGGVIDVATVTSQAALVLLDSTIKKVPDNFYDPIAHDSLKNSVSPNQVNMSRLRQERPKLAVIIDKVLTKK